VRVDGVRLRVRCCLLYTSAYVSIRQHTSAYVSMSEHASDVRVDGVRLRVRYCLLSPHAVHASSAAQRPACARRFTCYTCSRFACVTCSPHTTICVLILLCVLILPYMCPHTTIYVSSYYYICVLIILLYLERQQRSALRLRKPL
jgi:hypothetical protein